jgi:predicted DCC family thiol-disulfide oxidoreductase YuxK
LKGSKRNYILNSIKSIDQPIILFDGVCNFCNSAVNFVIKKDKKKAFRFAPLQSAAGQILLNQYGLSTSDLKSFVLIEDNEAFTKTTAALKVMKHLSTPWPLMQGFLVLPPFVRDVVYNLIARNRYKWFGKKEECMVPTPELKSRFL